MSFPHSIPGLSPTTPILLETNGAGQVSQAKGATTLKAQIFVPIKLIAVSQVVGFIPLTDCRGVECRPFMPACKYINPVFGIGGLGTPLVSTYENDLNSFFIIPQLVDPLNQRITFVLQKCINNVWSDVVTLDSNYGTLYSLGDINNHPDYMGFVINWGLVLKHQGPNTYRIVVYQSDNEPVVDWWNIYFTRSNPRQFLNFNSGVTIQLLDGTSFLIPLKGQFVTTQQLASALNTDSNMIANNITFTIVDGFIIAHGYGGNYATAMQFDNTPLIVTETDIDSVSNWVPTCLLYSEAFNCMEWNCIQAHGTVKFEAYLTGKIGDIRQDYLIHDLEGITLYDSVRVRGFFGFETISKFIEITLEWGPPTIGKIERIRDEAVQQFEFYSNPLPKYLHDRIGVYGMMSDELFVSDYNINNSDYSIKHVGIVKSGTYAPEYYDGESLQRFGKVKVVFNRNPQSVIKTIC